MKTLFLFFTLFTQLLNAQHGLQSVTKADYENMPTWQAEETGNGSPPRFDLLASMPSPHPKGQGNQLSCTAWAVAYAAKSYLEAIEHRWKPNTTNKIFSPAFLYNQINNGVDKGSTYRRAFKVLDEQGCATLSMMPYNDRNHTAKPSKNAKMEALRYKNDGYAVIREKAGIRLALTQGHPVLVAVLTDPVFMTGDYEIFNKTERKKGAKDLGGGKHGRHAMVIVGYDDIRKAYLFMNSWGNRWGKSGYCWVSYDLIDNKIFPNRTSFLQEAYIMRDKKSTKYVPPPAPTPQNNTIKLLQTDRYAGKRRGKDYWNWKVKVAGPVAQISQIRKVVYVLHPSFPNPRREVKNGIENGFAFESNGWGGFNIKAIIYLKSGKQFTLSKKLVFNDQKIGGLRLNNVSRFAYTQNGRDGKAYNYYQWCAFIDGPTDTLNQVSDVTYYLHPTFRENVIKITDASHHKTFKLTKNGWGPFDLKAKVTFKNGNSVMITKRLEFGKQQTMQLSSHWN